MFMMLFSSYAGPGCGNSVAYPEKIKSTIPIVRYNSTLLVQKLKGTVLSHTYKNNNGALHQEGVITTSRLSEAS